MSDPKTKLKHVVDQLRTERDELRVRAHLLKAELRDEWEAVEAKWEKLEPKLERLREGTKESAGDVGAAISQLGEEIAHTYRRLRDALK
jgi:predicted  nucleic acid-binding Zn-ribbon protein